MARITEHGYRAAVAAQGGAATREMKRIAFLSGKHDRDAALARAIAKEGQDRRMFATLESVVSLFAQATQATAAWLESSEYPSLLRGDGSPKEGE